MADKIINRLVLGCISFFTLAAIIWKIGGLGLPDLFWYIILGFWLCGLAVLEINLMWRDRNPLPRILKHLRYGPIVVMLFSSLVVIAFDQAMIGYSRYEIRSYVYGNTSPDIEVRFELYSDYRSWCGNGYTANEYSNYADTAAEGFSSTDPAVRARSLRVSIAVYDWLNGARYGPFPALIEMAEFDEDKTVRKIADEFIMQGR